MPLNFGSGFGRMQYFFMRNRRHAFGPEAEVGYHAGGKGRRPMHRASLRTVPCHYIAPRVDHLYSAVVST